MRELHLLTLTKIRDFSELVEDNLLEKSQEAIRLVGTPKKKAPVSTGWGLNTVPCCAYAPEEKVLLACLCLPMPMMKSCNLRGYRMIPNVAACIKRRIVLFSGPGGTICVI